jgi:hypothetical protein
MIIIKLALPLLLVRKRNHKKTSKTKPLSGNLPSSLVQISRLMSSSILMVISERSRDSKLMLT